MAENKSPSQRWGAPLPIRDDESVAVRSRRSLGGALYGLLGGSAFALFAGTVDMLTYPDLPIYTDWASIFVLSAWLAFVLAGVGAIIGWFTDRLRGVAVGASILALTLLLLTATQADFIPVANFIFIILLILPVTVICIPIAMILRSLANRHMNALDKTGLLRARDIVWLVFLALLLGSLPASLLRTSGRGERSLRTIDTLLQNAAAGQVDTRLGRQLERIPAFKAHIDTSYQLKQESSIISTEGFEIKIIYADGYQVTCTMVAYGTQKPYLYECVEGEATINY